MRDVRWHTVRNQSGEAIPAFAAMLVTGQDGGVLTVGKPNANGIDPARLLINGPGVIPVNGMGSGTHDWPWTVLTRIPTGARTPFTPSLSSGSSVTWGTVDGQWYVQPGNAGFMHLADMASSDAPIAWFSPACCASEPAAECCPSFACEPLCAAFTNLVFYSPTTSEWTISSLQVTGFAHAPTGHNAVAGYPSYTAVTSVFELTPHLYKTAIVSVAFNCIDASPDVFQANVTLRGVGYAPSSPVRSFDIAYGMLLTTDSCDMSPFETPSPVSFSSTSGGSTVAGDYDLSNATCAYATCYPASVSCLTASIPTYCCADGASWWCSPEPLPAALSGTIIDDGVNNIIPVGTPCYMARLGTGVINGLAFVYQFDFGGTSAPAFVTCDGNVYALHYSQSTSPIPSPVLRDIIVPALIGTVDVVHSCDPMDIEILFNGATSHTAYRAATMVGVRARLTE